MSEAIANTTALLGRLIAYPTVSSDSNLEMIAELATRLEGCGARVSMIQDESWRKANLFATLGPDGPGGLVRRDIRTWCRSPTRTGPIIRS